MVWSVYKRTTQLFYKISEFYIFNFDNLSFPVYTFNYPEFLERVCQLGQFY